MAWPWNLVFGVLHIIKSRSNLSCLLLTFRQHLLPLSKWLPVPIFSARCRCCGEKSVVEMWQGICPRISVHCVSLNILLANFDRFSDPSCWAVTFSAQDAGFIPSYDMTWFSFTTWSVIADLFCCSSTDCFRCFVNFVLSFNSTSVLCSFSLQWQKVFPLLQHRPCHSSCRGFCTHTHSLLLSELYPLGEPGFSSVLREVYKLTFAPWDL